QSRAPPLPSRRWPCLPGTPTLANLGYGFGLIKLDMKTKGYGFGLIKLDMKTKSENGLEFTSSETTKVTGSVESKYRWMEDGLTSTEKENMDNALRTEIAMEGQPARGLKLTSNSSFLPNAGEKNAKIKTGYKREHINLGCDVDFDITGPSICGALVLVTQSNFAAGYKTDEFQLHTNVNEGTEFGGSIQQKVNKKLERAVNLAWTAGNSNTRFGIAATRTGLGYTQTLKPGIKPTLSAPLDGRNVDAGGRKHGLGLEFQA
uniref:Non-selective voltage-gated ion channel VDAC1 n=1 Tax=Chinchilla lanigera TaxID=34839 RepID=A0A8C2YNG4_CHILA